MLLVSLETEPNVPYTVFFKSDPAPRNNPLPALIGP